LLMLFGLASSSQSAAQSPSKAPLQRSELSLDSLLRSPGPAWLSGQSDYFVVHVERNAHASPTQMLDSLEAAWMYAITLVGAPVAESPRVQVLVTTSRTRFPRLLSPQTKGLTTLMPRGGEVIILVANDSVRALTRHEVMHVVAGRAWGPSAPSSGVWLIEGLATFADGRCQGTTIAAVGRDILKLEPTLSAEALMSRFEDMWKTDRGRAYVLAGTFVGSLWESRGRDGVRRLWQGSDTLKHSSFPGSRDDLTTEWRAHVRRAAGTSPGLSPAAFQRWSCG
jgi:hypothetical protein